MIGLWGKMTEVRDTVAAGNTRTRSFTLTFFDDEEVDNFMNLENNYLLLSWEICPKTKRKHCHGAVYFHNARTFNSMKNQFPKAHIEIVRDWPQLIEYIKKDDFWLDYGEPPKGHRCITGKELKEMSEYDINYRYPMHARSLLNARDKIIGHELKMNMFNKFKDGSLYYPDILVINGYSGSGKTHTGLQYVLSRFKNEEIGIIDFDEKFMTGDVRCKCLICLEFRPHCTRPQVLLQLLDKFGIVARVLGGDVYVRPECVVLCSIVKVSEWFKNEEINDQFLRRVKIIDLGGYKLDEKIMKI